MGHQKNQHVSERYSQNEIVNKKVVRKLVKESGIREGDVVYDIGAGTGNITAALLDKGVRVFAVEKDGRRCSKLERRFAPESRVKVVRTDFLDIDLSSVGNYKVFANIPFFHTADIIKKLLFNKAPPIDCYLVVQREAAEKYVGIPADTLVSLLIKPLFWVDILYHFRRNDFFPVPSVDIVLVQFERRRYSLLSEEQYPMYREFIMNCRERTDRPVKQVLKEYFSYLQIKHMFRLLRIDYYARPTELRFRQYVGLFQFYSRQFERK